MVVAIFLFLIVGYFIGSFCSLVDFKDYGKKKAICKKFQCKANEFSYFLEDSFDYYIISVHDEEFRIKFSDKKPYQIVFCQLVERI